MFLLPWLIAIFLAGLDEWVMTLLVRREYKEHRLAWETDGKPRGMFWIPEECKIGRWYITYASGHSAQVVRWKWIFKTPDWMTNDRAASQLLRLHRLLMPAFFGCIIAPFVIAGLFR